MGLITPSYLLIFWIIFNACFLVLTAIALVDILRSKFEDNGKLIWILVVLLVLAIGPILYFAIGRRQRIRE